MKNKNPKFDKDGYQIGMADLNGEPLPELGRAKVLRRPKAQLPSVLAVQKALSALQAGDAGSYVRVREDAGLTQAQFATAIGVKLATYRQWEHGRRKPTGPAMTLLRLVGRRPELIRELQKTD